MNSLYINEAINEAKKAYEIGEVPVGAVIVKNDTIIARAHNLKESLLDPTCHAEILAIKEACKAINNWRLSDCTMYVTLEPCPMCASAIAQSRISNLYIGTFDDKNGACGSVINIVQNESLHYWINTIWLYNLECSDLMTNFFKEQRIKSKSNNN